MKEIFMPEAALAILASYTLSLGTFLDMRNLSKAFHCHAHILS